MDNIYKVSLNLAINEPYDYKIMGELKIGQVVLVPLRGKKEFGIVLEKDNPSVDIKKIKPITSSYEYILSPKQIEFLKWVANYTMSPIGMIVNMSIPEKDVFEVVKKEKLYNLKENFVLARENETRIKLINFLKNYRQNLSIHEMSLKAKVPVSTIKNLITFGVLEEKEEKDQDEIIDHDIKTTDFSYLNEEQRKAYDAVKHTKDFKTFLINGVTGSGKTEVYFAAIADQLNSGKQALIMLPEISLTAQFLERFKKVFGIYPTLWHSGLRKKERRVNWKNIYNGNAKIIVGTRSSLFLPFKDLGLIVVDEEHDGSYKQEDIVLYNARDMAVMKAKIENVPIILASATPSLETLVNCESGKMTELHLLKRHNEAVMPDVFLIDMKQNKPQKILNKKSWLSDMFVGELAQTLSRGEQGIVFLNRRGYAPLVICEKCGHKEKCDDCDSNMVLHSNQYGEKMICHHCGKSRQIPHVCSFCNEENSFNLSGPGIERIAEELKFRFPKNNILILSTDTSSGFSDIQEAVAKIENKEVDIIIGTQILTKGHNFPLITFVGIVDGDMSLMGNDFRGAEKTFCLLEQTSGRAGRYEKPGKVFIQTYQPDNIVMQALLKKDKHMFLEFEKDARRALEMPPYGKLASIIISGTDKNILNQFCNECARIIPNNPNVKIYGPMIAPISYLRGKYRMRFLVQTTKNTNMQNLISSWLGGKKTPSSISLKVDIDPYSFT